MLLEDFFLTYWMPRVQTWCILSGHNWEFTCTIVVVSVVPEHPLALVFAHLASFEEITPVFASKHVKEIVTGCAVMYCTISPVYTSCELSYYILYSALIAFLCCLYSLPLLHSVHSSPLLCFTCPSVVYITLRLSHHGQTVQFQPINILHCMTVSNVLFFHLYFHVWLGQLVDFWLFIVRSLMLPGTFAGCRLIFCVSGNMMLWACPFCFCHHIRHEICSLYEFLTSV